jgi:hypothetical protein
LAADNADKSDSFHVYPRLKIPEHLKRRISTGRAHDAATGMRR